MIVLAMPLTLQQAVDQLADRSSTKRRSAAKQLRKLGDPTAGPALLEALRDEINDPRTWETQYQMVMALGTCLYTPSEELLTQLADEQREYTMVGVALGDALTRIEWASRRSLVVLDRYLPNGAPGVIDGMFRAIAMQRLVPDDAVIARIINFVTPLGLDDPLRYWVAAAAASWTGPTIETYLRRCLASNRQDLAAAAQTALQGTHVKHRPL